MEPMNKIIELSAYNINRFGILVYSGMPTSANDMTFEHHNGRQYSSICSRNKYQYEVGAIGPYGLINGRPYRKFEF